MNCLVTGKHINASAGAAEAQLRSIRKREQVPEGGSSMKRIVLTRRSHDWHACIDGDKTAWDCGKSTAEAIGALVLTHRDKLDIRVEWEPTPFDDWNSRPENAA